VSELARELADDLAEAAVAIDDNDRLIFEDGRRSPIGCKPAGAHPFQVLADANHPM
jgi:hypothetical protein